MAILYTQGKYLILNPIEIDGTPTDEVSVIVTEPSQQSICKLQGNNKKANAALICDAVNNTVGKGIDPNAVPGLLEVLEIISQHAYDDDTPKGDILADFDNMRGLAINAIKSADLK